LKLIDRIQESFGIQNLLFRRVSPVAMGAVCVVLTALIGFADYLTGYERTIFVIYLVPIALATWAGGVSLGIIVSALSVSASAASDVFAGIPEIRFWDGAVVFIAYIVFTWVLARWHDLVYELDQRVRDRTSALQREVREREMLEREVASITERERRRLGQELHDTLCQHLAGTSLMAHALAEKLDGRKSTEAHDAREIVALIESATTLSHDLARGLFSPELEGEGLSLALQALAAETSERNTTECIFDDDLGMAVRDSAVATALYRIAREAVTNAVKHARARQIVIRLRSTAENLALTVSDDGEGINGNAARKYEGLGMRMMAHSAANVGGKFVVETGSQGGTTLSCTVADMEEGNN